MYEVIQARIREAGKITYFLTGGLKTSPGEYIIIEEDRGLEYAQVISEAEIILETDVKKPLGKIIRKTTHGDLYQIGKNAKKAKDFFDICEKKIEKYKLPMKLVESEYSFDRSKVTFYFTAEGRIDFRELVKELAHEMKARIEMRQIGVRDEAKMLGGLGPCGRDLCCARFLKDFEPVTIKMAKEQNLPLNPTKISGLCGRLMCCLSYEYVNYKEMRKSLPKEGERLKTKEGPGKVIQVNALTRSVTVELEGGKQLEVKCE